MLQKKKLIEWVSLVDQGRWDDFLEQQQEEEEKRRARQSRGKKKKSWGYWRRV